MRVILEGPRNSEPRRTTPDIASPFQTPAPHQLEDVWPLTMIYHAIHGRSSKESGFEPETLRLRSRWIATRPPRSLCYSTLMPKSWKNLPPNFIDSEVEENVQIEEIQLTSIINQLQNTNPMSNTETLQWAAEADVSLARNEILTVDETIRTVTAEDDDDDDDSPVKPVKISHSEAVATLNTSLQWSEEKNFKVHEIMFLGGLKDRAF
ncbi:hypothetical protein AVEN_264764-1 [Araneus ventricosus]|uniref:DDE-1 domain-containing protein n=1 Tax=Araneus ventricosus TaxID=182803 RepID=A0A4Y2EDQ3_ARAVE|nr:hypothetical protein AVEN_264764-1 [Araneus ventricosus]